MAVRNDLVNNEFKSVVILRLVAGAEAKMLRGSLDMEERVEVGWLVWRATGDESVR